MIRKSFTVLLFLVAYGGLALVALPPGGSASGLMLLWPAAGLVVAILLHAPHRQWFTYLGMAGLGSAAAALLAGESVYFAVACLIAHPAEAWIAARLLRRRKRQESELLREWLADAASIGIVAPAAGGLIVATTMAVAAGWVWPAHFLNYLFAHSLGIMVFFPFFSLVVGGSLSRWIESNSPARKLEMAAFLALVAITICGAVWQTGSVAYLMPVLVALIVTCRFGMTAASLSIFVLALSAWCAEAAGTFIQPALPLGLQGTVQFLQFYLAVVVICLQPLAGHITQNRRLADALREKDKASDSLDMSLEAKDFVINESQSLYRLLAENMSDIIIKTDREGYILYASPSAEKLTDLHPVELLGKHVLSLIHPSYTASFQSELERVIADGAPASAWHEFLGFSSSGNERWFDTKIRSWRGDDRRVDGAIITMRSIEQRKALEQQLFAAILTDPLTKLTNRRAFNSMLQYHLDAPIDGCLAIFDIDDFRSINRDFGHEVGDKVLTTVARLLRSLMRKDDIISRIGGERFAVLLSGASPEQAEALCQRVVLTLSDISGPDGLGGPRATVSAGVARIRDSLDETMKRADAAVVMAKAKGRNRLEMATNGRQRWTPGEVPWIET